MEGFEVRTTPNLYEVINEICHVVKEVNVDTFLVVGKSPTIRAVNIVADTLSIPVLGYMVDDDQNMKVCTINYITNLIWRIDSWYL